MCCKQDITEQKWFIWAVDVLHWYVHRNDKTDGGEVKPPPDPPPPEGN